MNPEFLLLLPKVGTSWLPACSRLLWDGDVFLPAVPTVLLVEKYGLQRRRPTTIYPRVCFENLSPQSRSPAAIASPLTAARRRSRLPTFLLLPLSIPPSLPPEEIVPGLGDT